MGNEIVLFHLHLMTNPNRNEIYGTFRVFSLNFFFVELNHIDDWCKDVTELQIAPHLYTTNMYISCNVVFIYLIDNLSIMSILCQSDKLASNM